MTFVPSKLIPTKVGADPKKVGILAGLVVVLVVVWLMNRSSIPEGPVTPSATPSVVPARPSLTRNLPPELSPGPRVATRSTSGSGSERTIADFRPTLKLKEGTDVSKIDPSLHLDLLAKVKTVGLTGGARSLFEFAPPPAPPPPEVAKIYPKVGPVPPPPPPKPAPPPTAPPPPPIPLKFYGYSGTARTAGVRSAFFLDGEDIVIARENEMIRNRYKILRIGVNSALVEDTVSKNQQTLPLIEELGS
jgi:hypothetical protein